VLSTRKETMLKSSFLFQRVPETSKVLKFIEVLRKVRPILEPCRTAASTCSSVTVRTKLAVEPVTMPTLEADPSTDSAHHSACADDCDTCARACEACIVALSAQASAEGKESANGFRDCASVCRLAAELFARESRFARQISQQCARICAACAAECRLREGIAFAECARACEACIRHCS